MGGDTKDESFCTFFFWFKKKKAEVPLFFLELQPYRGVL